MFMCALFFFFFQAEDGIRDVAVTGVQTCALPISYEFDKMLAFWQQALHYVPREPATSGSGRSSRPSGEGAEPVFEPRFERNVPASEADCTSTCTQQSRGGSRTFNQRWGDPRYPWRYKPGRDFEIGRASCRERV